MENTESAQKGPRVADSIESAVLAEREACIDAVAGEELCEPQTEADEAYNLALSHAIAAIRARFGGLKR